MKVAVLGCGGVGSEIARQLAGAGAVDELVVADLDVATATALADEVGAQWRQFDARDPDSVARVLDDAEVVCNAVGPFHKFALSIVEAAIATGTHYVDINDDYDVADALVGNPHFDEAARAAGVVVLTGAGSAPGLTNLMARRAASELDRTDAVHVVMGVPFIVNLGPAILEHMFHCASGDVTQFLDGEYRIVPAGGGRRRFDLLPPFGSYDFGYLGHSEAVTLPRFLPGVRDVTTRFSWFQPAGNDVYRALADWGFMSADTNGLPIAPRQYLAAFMCSEQGEAAMSVDISDAPLGAVFHVVAEGRRDGMPTSVAFEVHQWMDPTDAGDPLTAICAARAVTEVASGSVAVRGVQVPESCLDPEPFMRAVLAARRTDLYRCIDHTELLFSSIEGPASI
jgi:saccharopine dehydrogenase (NAD+, L-lysine-forming)